MFGQVTAYIHVPCRHRRIPCKLVFTAVRLLGVMKWESLHSVQGAVTAGEYLRKGNLRKAKLTSVTPINSIKLKKMKLEYISRKTIGERDLLDILLFNM